MKDLRRIKFRTEYEMKTGKSYPHQGFFHGFTLNSHQVYQDDGSKTYINIPSAIIEMPDGMIIMHPIGLVRFENSEMESIN